MTTSSIIITHIHEKGFAFAFETNENESVFIPHHLFTKTQGVVIGDELSCVLAPNYLDKSDRGTPWQAIKLLSPATYSPILAEDEADGNDQNFTRIIDEQVNDILCELDRASKDSEYSEGLTANQISKMLNNKFINEAVVVSSLDRLISGGGIEKSTLYNKI
tara:strand:+ start:517 stop:1002 length:486 start_codon:yes stop_codon:yes gene_type:complete